MEGMVVEALIFGDGESQVMAAKQVAQFTRKQRHKIAEKDIIPPLISMLHSQDYEAIEASLLALLNLAYGSERFVENIIPMLSASNFLYYILIFFVGFSGIRS